MTRGWFHLEAFLFGGNLSTMAILAWGWAISLERFLFSTPVSPWSPASMMAVAALFLLQRSLFLSLYFKLASPAVPPSNDIAVPKGDLNEPRLREVNLSLLDGISMLGLFASGLFLPAWLLTYMHAWVDWPVLGLSAVLVFTALMGAWIVIAAWGYRIIEKWFHIRGL